MKTSKIISTLATLNLVLFMSVSSIANPTTRYEGDLIKTSVKKQIGSIKTSINEISSPVSSENEFRNLRFDVNKFINDSEVAELTHNIIEAVRFDVNKFINADTEISELPVANEFDYLRFDVTNFSNSSDLSELPVNEFDYLRFDVNKYSNENSAVIDYWLLNIKLIESSWLENSSVNKKSCDEQDFFNVSNLHNFKITFCLLPRP